MPTKGTVDVTDQRVEDSNPTMGEIKTDKRKGDVTVNENDDVAIRQIYGVTREEKVSVSEQKNLSHDLLYGVEDNPPWYLLIVFALQHCLLSIGGSVGAPLLIAANLCIFNDEIGDRAKAELVGTILFINGVSTLIQSTVGTRLPIMQGSSFAFFVPSVAILSLPQNLCPDPILNSSNSSTVLYNDTDGSIVDGEELWKRRITELQGPFIVAALFELTIGLTGLVGWLTRFIGPLTIAPTISLIGFELIEVAPVHASHHWGIAFFTAGVLIITSEYMVNLKVPFPYYKRNHGCKVFRGKFFRIFPVTLAMGLGWLLSYILTVTNVLSSDRDHHEYLARTDASSTVIEQSPWFRFPYPGQWGLPKFAVAGMLAMCAGSLASVIESIGDYAGCAKLAGAPVPPPHAINRGIMIEGLGCLLAGTWGTGTGVTSYSENIAAIGVTRVGSRRVMQVAGVFYIVVGCLTKFGSVLTTIPDPVFGGVFMVVFGFIIAVGLSNLQHVDLNSHRNIFVLGSSLFMGLMISQSVKKGAIVISTGVVELDQTIQVLLSSALFVGGFLGMFFDNTLPGTDEERGMTSYRAQAPEKSDDEPTTKAERCYDLPFRTNFRFSRYIPILPEFRKSKKSASGKVNMGYNVEECDVESSSDATSL